jgi:hypothetical protein
LVNLNFFGALTATYRPVKLAGMSTFWAKFIKKFTGVIYKCSQASLFVPDKPFKPCLMRVGKVRSQVFHSTVVPGHSHKLYARLGMLSRGEHSSLLRAVVNYSCKVFYNIGPWKVMEATVRVIGTVSDGHLKMI